MKRRLNRIAASHDITKHSEKLDLRLLEGYFAIRSDGLAWDIRSWMENQPLSKVIFCDFIVTGRQAPTFAVAGKKSLRVWRVYLSWPGADAAYFKYRYCTGAENAQLYYITVILSANNVTGWLIDRNRFTICNSIDIIYDITPW